MFTIRTAAAALAFLLITIARAGADQTATDNNWHWRVTPYVWVPSVNGAFNFQTADMSGLPGVPVGALDTIHVKVGPNQYLNHFNSAGQLTADVHRGDLGVFFDFMFMNLSSSTNSVTQISGPLGHIVIPVDIGTSMRLTNTLAEIAPEYTLWRRGNSSLDGFVGYASLNVHGSVAWSLSGPNGLINPTGSAGGGRSLGDFIVGVKGRVGLDREGKWFVPYYLDGGLGTDNTRWQGLVGIGYGRRSSAELFFRNLQYNPNSGFMDQLRLGGPGVAYTFEL